MEQFEQPSTLDAALWFDCKNAPQAPLAQLDRATAF